jgi:hypothetical protein
MNAQNDKGEGRKMVGTEETIRSGPWIYIRTHVNSYAIVADYSTSDGVTVRRYIAQLIPDLEIARLFTCAREMQALLEDVAEFIADGLVYEGAGYQDIEARRCSRCHQRSATPDWRRWGQSLYRDINDLLRRQRTTEEEDEEDE